MYYLSQLGTPIATRDLPLLRRHLVLPPVVGIRQR